MVKSLPKQSAHSKRLRTAQHVSGKVWRRAAASVPLQHAKHPIAKPWPVSALRAFDHSIEVGWGHLLRDVLKSRGWTVKTACHSIESKWHTTIFTKEFEALLRQVDPKVAFGKQGAIQEGYRLRKIPLPPRALWMQGVTSDYRVPGVGTRATTREDCAKLVAKYRHELPGAPGCFRVCGYPGVNNTLAKTNFSEYLRDTPWYPYAYLLPKEESALLKRFANAPDEYWIAKPRNAYSGTGIKVWKANDPALAEMVRNQSLSSIVQRYVADPVLLGGYKFHMRIHLVITSLSPPEAYVQAGGQCLFCTKPYSLSKGTLGAKFDAPVHLSNTGLNMENPQKESFLKKKPVIGSGQQISMRQLEAYLAENYPRFKRHALWSQILQIAKEVVQYVAQAPAIQRNGKFGKEEFFDIFGMDLMLDKNLKVWMCETNNSPSLEDQDKIVWGKTNPDYKKEHKCFVQLWNDIFTLLGLDASRHQSVGTLRNWYQVDFSGGRP